MARRDGEADPQLVKVLEYFDEKNARKHLEHMEWMKLVSYGKQVVSPIGDSYDRTDFCFRNSEKETTNTPMAETIRAQGQSEPGKLELMRIKVDGCTNHNRRLQIVHPDDSGKFFNAVVRDPEFDTTPNVYIDAAVKQEYLRVHAMTSRREGKLTALYIFDAKRLNDNDGTESI